MDHEQKDAKVFLNTVAKLRTVIDGLDGPDGRLALVVCLAEAIVLDDDESDFRLALAMQSLGEIVASMLSNQSAFEIKGDSQEASPPADPLGKFLERRRSGKLGEYQKQIWLQKVLEHLGTPAAKTVLKQLDVWEPEQWPRL